MNALTMTQWMEIILLREGDGSTGGRLNGKILQREASTGKDIRSLQQRAGVSMDVGARKRIRFLSTRRILSLRSQIVPGDLGFRLAGAA